MSMYACLWAAAAAAAQDPMRGAAAEGHTAARHHHEQTGCPAATIYLLQPQMWLHLGLKTVCNNKQTKFPPLFEQ